MLDTSSETQIQEVQAQELVSKKAKTFPFVTVILVSLSLALVAYMAFLNYEMTKVAGAQLIRSQQLQELAQSKFMDQYAQFLQQQNKLARFEKSFEVRQKHYTGFMGALSDAWLSVNKKDRSGLDAALHNLAKSYYGIEPFLEEGGRHYLKKRISIFHNLAKQLVGSPPERKGIALEDKSTMNRMIEDFQSYLYPLLFDPLAYQEEQNNEADR